MPDSAHFHLWESKLEYRSDALPGRLLAYEVAITEEGPCLCSELGVFEPYPLVCQLLTAS